jgi:hypothetical protein
VTRFVWLAGWLAASLIALFFLIGGTARADFFSTDPGRLIQGHAQIDNKDKCTECHVNGRMVSAEKCLVCHKAISERQREKRGLHASTKALGRPCELCHTDHKGRKADILGWPAFGGRDHFDHAALTGFALDGKHAQVACLKCHTQKNGSGGPTYLKTQQACASCHQNPHGDLREPLRRCERCHDARSWNMLEKAQFDHDRDARYPLEAKHERVTCVQCHAKRAGGEPPRAKKEVPVEGGAYKKLTFRWPTWSVDCQPCHDNVHGQSLFGLKACKLCHSAKVEFTKISFDHNKRTHFPLEGAHKDERKATCVSCHKKDERKAPDKKCETCHPDVHKDRFDKIMGGQCQACHTAVNFTTDIRFDHAGRSRFALTGAHAAADCRACHRGKGPTEWEHFEQLITRAPTGRGTVVACMGCHQHENVHKKQYPNERCLECHKMAGVRTTSTRAITEFHGPTTRFPLTEGHKGVACERCHPGNVFEKTPLQCGPKCHPDELHKGTLGNECLDCHTGGRWEARLFDHDTKTNWPLVGNHKDVLCEACHPRRDFAANRDKGRTCYNCHKKDDAHDGALGPRCERCHSPTGKVFFEHNDPKVSDWPLEGQHVQVACAACHKSIHFRPTSRDCGGCHPEPPIHKGQLGTLCGVCHDVKDWKNIRTGHEVPSPRFGGAHDKIACVQCHPGGRLLAGTAELCITCHRNDDIHHNALGPRCGECHTQRTFAAAHFEHNRVGCELIGVHRLLPCVDCHKGGNFVALAPECPACHRAEQIRAQSISMTPAGMQQGVISHAGLNTCSNCHNANSFIPAQGAAASGRESVCR